jgi:tRNA G37 N-methylase TrmD
LVALRQPLELAQRTSAAPFGRERTVACGRFEQFDRRLVAAAVDSGAIGS